MNDLRERIADHVNESVPPVDLDRLVAELARSDEHAQPLRPAIPVPLWRRRWVLAAAGIGVLVALIVATAWLTQGEEAVPVITQAPAPEITTTLPPEVTTTLPPESTSTTVPTETGAWTAHDIRGNDLGVTAVVPGGPGFVAVGTTCCFTQDDPWGRAQIWTSPDGEEWADVPNSDTLFEGGYFPTGVLSNGKDFIVWGRNDRFGGSVIWQSPDGVNWVLAADGDPDPLVGAPTRGLVLESGEFLLYGEPDQCNVVTGICVPTESPILQFSEDGLEWEVVETPVTFSAIAQMENGDLLGAPIRISQPTTWISADNGRTWTLYGPDRALEVGRPAGRVLAIATGPEGVVAAAVDEDKQPALWFSAEGRTFSAVHDLAPSSDDFALPIDAVAFADGWFVAVGGDGAGPCLLVSPDGITWSPVSLEGMYVDGGGLSDVAFRDGRFVAVGQQRFTAGGEAWVVVGTPGG